MKIFQHSFSFTIFLNLPIKLTIINFSFLLFFIHKDFSLLDSMALICITKLYSTPPNSHTTIPIVFMLLLHYINTELSSIFYSFYC